MSMRDAPRWEDTVPRRQARLTAVAVAVVASALTALALGVVLDRRADAAAARLNAACQDNLTRAFAAAQRARTAGVSEPAAAAAGNEYVKEVRLTPECFSASVAADADAVARAIKGGGRPAPEYPKGVQ